MTSPDTAKIRSFEAENPLIYAYCHPDYPPHAGWTKIGYTERQTVEDRVREQNGTSHIAYDILWQAPAWYTSPPMEKFHDSDFHAFLTRVKGVERMKEKGRKDPEWFKIDGPQALMYLNEFAARKVPEADQQRDYTPRDEQAAAVEKTAAYFAGGGAEFLWNAKPRFGKTLTAYELMSRMGAKNVLVVTNRPAVGNSWADDFFTFIEHRGEYYFVSENDALRGRPGVLSRDEYLKAITSGTRGMVAFYSLQDLKGSVHLGNPNGTDKLRWLSKNARDAKGRPIKPIEFDLIIIDESQEGADTRKADKVFDSIRHKHMLFLSGTPFKALADGRFGAEQIFNWSYADEQEAKRDWHGETFNPYEALPVMNMFTYQLSPMIRGELARGADLSEDESVDYAFDLNEFFAVDERGVFVHKAEIAKFLDALTTNEKYPFSTPQLRDELKHTLWLLDRVASARALARMLAEHPVFKEYEVVLAAGDGKLNDDDENEKSYDKVKAAIKKHEKTITLSVGQLTVGVTIPEWSGVLMLCNLQSASAYMQAAFRAQNPCSINRGGQWYRKERSYIFDFDPARTLIIFDEFANNLCGEGAGTTEKRKANIGRLLNFFPVLGEDDEGRMVQLDADRVMSIPARLKCVEVVRRGFMSNFLFRNIGAVFGAPAAVREIIEKLTPSYDVPKGQRDDKALDKIDDIPVDDRGEVVINVNGPVFGPKVYANAVEEVTAQIDTTAKNDDPVAEKVEKITETVTEALKKAFIQPKMDEYQAKPSAQKRIITNVERKVEQEFQALHEDYQQKAKIAEIERAQQLRAAQNKRDEEKAKEDFAAKMAAALDDFKQAAEQKAEQIINDTPVEVVKQLEQNKFNSEKRGVEDEVRARLRGFSRTIPSFIMAYGGDENGGGEHAGVTLANFEARVEPEVFEQVTGITVEQFRFLRDGGEYTDKDSGQVKHFNGHLFDETVFNDAVEEFWTKKSALADYFDESQTEDIFDYIPPQKTNQIFTPRAVVRQMVELLEAENPGCFDDPNATFADLYMKSGLYITEIVKRLFASPRVKAAYPDDGARLRHILTKQVYGMAPTRIIWLIAVNFILGFDPELKRQTKNFVQADAAEAAKNGTLQELVDRYFGA